MPAHPATGKLTVYNPLVLDAGARPAIAPVTPRLAAGSVVGNVTSSYLIQGRSTAQNTAANRASGSTPRSPT